MTGPLLVWIVVAAFAWRASPPFAAGSRSTTLATHSTCASQFWVDAENRLTSAKSQSIGNAWREKTPETKSPAFCHFENLQPLSTDRPIASVR